MTDGTGAVRLATAHDVDAIFDVRVGVRENILTRAELTERGITRDAVLAMIGEASCVWVVEFDSEVVGFSMADAEDACVFAAFVRPDHEGRGLGSVLMAAAEAFLFQHHERIWLETAYASRAREFYERRGWVQTAELDDGDVRMEKVLLGRAISPG